MDWRNLHGLIEISPFMLFESTGDSEEDSDLNNMDDSTYDDEVDDAQSCCSDSSEIYNSGYNHNDQFREYYSCTKKSTDQERGHYHQNNYNEDEEDDDGSSMDQECSGGNVGFLFSREEKKCKVYNVDSAMEPPKKEEKDKLFWDTCLAS